ncbi:hypothetical protein EMB92_06230 [Bifidobacterium callitrichos]|uniref:Uncharacterized protein n=1 Tax=Bifidobacterium callitrichos TaxID=762209 RepID=A0A5M9ZCI7_9BIFI|nr:alpha/beta hydrolase fold domain-containing protein [Bifidobacterium callitrichos]KAA8816496.1 hypothetical protein EMB92_06230 [Bifidobacterium callitrichos]
MGGRASSRMTHVVCAVLAVMAMFAAAVMPVRALADSVVPESAAASLQETDRNTGAASNDQESSTEAEEDKSAETDDEDVPSANELNSESDKNASANDGNSVDSTTGATNTGTEASAGTSDDNSDSTTSDGNADSDKSDAAPVTPSTGTTVVNGNIVTHADVPYMAPWSAEQTQKLDVYNAASAATAADGKGQPVVVFIHGGAWIHGDKSFLSERMPLVNTLLQSGYVVASINYRLAAESPWPAQINDCNSAVRFLREHAAEYGIDPDRIAVFGESAGAHLAMMMGVTNGSRQFVNTQDGNKAAVSSDVQAVISGFGISEVDDWGKLSGDDVSTAVYAKNLLFGVTEGKQYTEAQAKEASPLTYVSAKAAPMLLVHGQNDRTVSYRQTVMMEQALKQAGAKNVSTWYPEYGPHGFTDVFCENVTAQQRYLDFLSKVFPQSQQGSTDSTHTIETVPVYRFYQSSHRTHLFSAQANETTVLGQDWTGWLKEGIVFRVLPDAESGPAQDSGETSNNSNKDAVSSGISSANGISADETGVSAAQPSTVTISRMHNTSTDDYIYTGNTDEINVLRRNGWVEESVFRTIATGGISIHRLYDVRTNRHMLVSNDTEKRGLIAHGWRDEGIAFHAYAVDQLSVSR